jgi:hypothetical protein
MHAPPTDETAARKAGFFRPRPIEAMVDSKNRPYFAWDTEWTLDEFLARLNGPDRVLSDLLLARMMRQAAPADVFAFITFDEVAARLPALLDNLGDRRAFWVWFFDRVPVLRAPAFQRVQVSGTDDGESCVVDLVHDGSMRWAELTPFRDGSSVLVPPVDYLLADKILALLGRKEIRDLADSFILLRSGAKMGRAWAIARGQDPGLDAATLGWVLDEWDLVRMCQTSTIDRDVLAELVEFRQWFQRWLIEHTSMDLDEI